MNNTFFKAVFLDRDGVINEILLRNGKLSVPYGIEEFKILKNVKEAIRSLKKQNFLCIVITNQPDIEKGNLEEAILLEINAFIKQEIGIDEVYFCPHSKDGGCNCKKPMTGMIQQALKHWNIDLSKSWVIGDRWRDIDMGKAIGTKTILINSVATQLDNKQLSADYTCNDLLEAAGIITRI